MKPRYKPPSGSHWPAHQSALAKQGVAQAKSNAYQPKLGRPAAPPVYRPQVPPRVLQTKRGAPVAPSVYRPQPVPKVLQQMRQASRQPVAPPVYRPEPKKIVQPKMLVTAQARKTPKAPPVYRPQQKKIAQPKMIGNAARIIQRKLRVDSMDDGEVFKKMDFVASHWGFNAAEKKVYLRWLKDDVDHHYPTRKALIEAVKNPPTTLPFVNIFKRVAKNIQNDQKGTTKKDWLEQLLTDKESVLQTLNAETDEELLEKLSERDRNSTLKLHDLPQTTLRALLNELMKTRVMTQSCGESANMLQEFLSPGLIAPPVKVNTDQICGKITEANANSERDRQHHYVRIGAGGHEFIVEVYRGVCKIYQSFLGTYSLARDLKRDKLYPIDELLPLLEKALTPTDIKQQAPQDVQKARFELFNSRALHPNGSIKVTTFTQEPGTHERIQNRLATQQVEWNRDLDQPSTNYLGKKNSSSQQQNDEPPVTVMDYDFKTIAYMMIDRSGRFPDKDIAKGRLALDTILHWEQHEFKLESKTQTNYRFVWVKPTQ